METCFTLFRLLLFLALPLLLLLLRPLSRRISLSLSLLASSSLFFSLLFPLCLSFCCLLFPPMDALAGWSFASCESIVTRPVSHLFITSVKKQKGMPHGYAVERRERAREGEKERRKLHSIITRDRERESE